MIIRKKLASSAGKLEGTMVIVPVNSEYISMNS